MENQKTLADVTTSLDKEVDEIIQESVIILKLESMIDKIIMQRDNNVSQAITSIKETIQRSEYAEINEDDPLSIKLKQAIDTRNITGESAEKEIEKRVQRIKIRIESLKMSLRFLQNVVGLEHIGNIVNKIEQVEDSLSELM